MGIYARVSYEDFDVASHAILNESVSGVIPDSDSNPALVITTASTPPTLMALCSGLQAHLFSLRSFYYGYAVQSDQGVTSITVACNITETGYKAGSSETHTSKT